HVERALREKNISFVTVKPRITRTDVENPYFSLLRNEKSPLEQLLAQNENIYSPRSAFNNQLFTRYVETMWELELHRKLVMEEGLTGQPLQERVVAERSRYAADNPNVDLEFVAENADPKHKVYVFKFKGDNTHVIIRPFETTDYTTLVKAERLQGENFMFQLVSGDYFNEGSNRYRILGQERPRRAGVKAMTDLIAQISRVRNPVTRFFGQAAIALAGRSEQPSLTSGRVLRAALNAATAAWAFFFGTGAGRRGLFAGRQNELIPRAIAWALENYDFNANNITDTGFEIALENVLALAEANPDLEKFIGNSAEHLALAGLAYENGKQPWIPGLPSKNAIALAQDYLEAEELAGKIIEQKGAFGNLQVKGNSYLAQLMKALRGNPDLKTFILGRQDILSQERLIPEFTSARQAEAIRAVFTAQKMQSIRLVGIELANEAKQEAANGKIINLAEYLAKKQDKDAKQGDQVARIIPMPQLLEGMDDGISAAALAQLQEEEGGDLTGLKQPRVMGEMANAAGDLKQTEMSAATTGESTDPNKALGDMSAGINPADFKDDFNLVGPAGAGQDKKRLAGIMDRALPWNRYADVQALGTLASVFKSLGIQVRPDGRATLSVKAMIQQVRRVRSDLNRERKALAKRRQFLARKSNPTLQEQQEMLAIRNTLGQHQEAVAALNDLSRTFRENGDRTFTIVLSGEMNMEQDGLAVSSRSRGQMCFNAAKLSRLAARRNILSLMKQVAHESGHLAGVENTLIGEGQAALIGKILSGYQISIAEMMAELGPKKALLRAILHGEEAPAAAEPALDLAAVGPAQATVLTETQKQEMKTWYDNSRGWTNVTLDIMTTFDRPLDEKDLAASVPKKADTDNAREVGVALLSLISAALAKATDNFYTAADLLEVFKMTLAGQKADDAVASYLKERAEYLNQLVPEEFAAYEKARGPMKSTEDVRKFIQAAFDGEFLAITPALQLFAGRLVEREQEALADANYAVELYLNFDSEVGKKLEALPQPLRAPAAEKIRTAVEAALAGGEGLGLLIARKIGDTIKTQAAAVAALRNFNQFRQKNFPDKIFAGQEQQILAAARAAGLALVLQLAARRAIGIHSNKAPPKMELLQQILPAKSNSEFILRKITTDQRFTGLFPLFTTQTVVTLSTLTNQQGYAVAISTLKSAGDAAAAKRAAIRAALQQALNEAALVADEMPWQDLAQYACNYYIQQYVAQVMTKKYQASVAELSKPEAINAEADLTAELNVLAGEIAALQEQHGGQAVKLAAVAPAPVQAAPEITLAEFTVDKRINHGASSNVYAAEYQGKKVAFIASKYMDPLAGADDQLSRRTTKAVQEAEEAITATVANYRTYQGIAYDNHPVALDIYAVVRNEQGQVIGYLCELLEGTELTELAATGAITPAQLNEALRQVREQLDVLHSKGLRHGDMRGDNVLVRILPDGKLIVRLVDFWHSNEEWSVADENKLFQRMETTLQTYIQPENVAVFLAKRNARAEQIKSQQFLAAQRQNAASLQNLFGALQDAMDGTQGRDAALPLARQITRLFRVGTKEARLWTIDDLKNLQSSLPAALPGLVRQLNEQIAADAPANIHQAKQVFLDHVEKVENEWKAFFTASETDQTIAAAEAAKPLQPLNLPGALLAFSAGALILALSMALPLLGIITVPLFLAQTLKLGVTVNAWRQMPRAMRTWSSPVAAYNPNVRMFYSTSGRGKNAHWYARAHDFYAHQWAQNLHNRLVARFGKRLKMKTMEEYFQEARRGKKTLGYYFWNVVVAEVLAHVLDCAAIIPALRDRFPGRNFTVRMIGRKYSAVQIAENIQRRTPASAAIFIRLSPQQQQIVLGLLSDEDARWARHNEFIEREVEVVGAYFKAKRSAAETAQTVRDQHVLEDAVMLIGQALKINAHGTSKIGGGIPNMVNILLWGKINFTPGRETAGTLGPGDARYAASTFGPSYVVVDPDQPDWFLAQNHQAYMVRDNQDRNVLVELIRRAADQGLISPQQADAAMARTITYAEFIEKNLALSKVRLSPEQQAGLQRLQQQADLRKNAAWQADVKNTFARKAGPTTAASKDIHSQRELESFAEVQKRAGSASMTAPDEFNQVVKNHFRAMTRILRKSLADPKILKQTGLQLERIIEGTLPLQVQTADQIRGGISVSQATPERVSVIMEERLEGVLRTSTVVHEIIEALLKAQGVKEAHAIAFIVEQSLFPQSLKAKLANPQHYDDAHLQRLIDTDTPAFRRAILAQKDVLNFVKQRQVKNVEQVGKMARKEQENRAAQKEKGRILSVAGARDKSKFETIEMEPTTVPVDDWALYNQCIKTAEAFSKSILTKPENDVVALINRATDKKLEAKDFTGGIKFGYYRQGANKLVFKVRFALNPEARAREALGDSVELTIVTKKAKGKEAITQDEIDGLKELSGTDFTPRFSAQFNYKGGKYYIEEFIDGPTARELAKDGKLTTKRRSSIIKTLLSISILMGGLMPHDIHGNNFVFDMNDPEERAVMVDLGSQRTTPDKALLRLVSLYGYFGQTAQQGNNRFIYQSFIDEYGAAAQDNGLYFLKKNIEHIKKAQAVEARKAHPARAPSAAKQRQREERGEPALQPEDVARIVEECEAFIREYEEKMSRPELASPATRGEHEAFHQQLHAMEVDVFADV
ncbi:hypothetical protein JW933_08365, partial [candidate division FCPU426 bacterium]|nr:hypothetical protein [candidate division FCPU426 bacterium]